MIFEKQADCKHVISVMTPSTSSGLIIAPSLAAFPTVSKSCTPAVIDLTTKLRHDESFFALALCGLCNLLNNSGLSAGTRRLGQLDGLIYFSQIVWILSSSKVWQISIPFPIDWASSSSMGSPTGTGFPAKSLNIFAADEVMVAVLTGTVGMTYVFWEFGGVLGGRDPGGDKDNGLTPAIEVWLRGDVNRFFFFGLTPVGEGDLCPRIGDVSRFDLTEWGETVPLPRWGDVSLLLCRCLCRRGKDSSDIVDKVDLDLLLDVGLLRSR